MPGNTDISILNDPKCALGEKNHAYEDVLEHLSVHLCDARFRNRWWHTGPHVANDKCAKALVEHSAGAAGRMMSDVVNFRAAIARKKSKDAYCSSFPPMSLQAFENKINLDTKIKLQTDDRTLKAFLQGHPTDPKKWWPFCHLLLRLALTSDVDEKSLERSKPFVDRICDYFFPAGYSKPEDDKTKADEWCFFDSRLRFYDCESTSREAVASIWRARRLGRCLVSNVAPCIIRTSAGARFQQTTPDGEDLLPSGRETLAALADGVRVVYVFPVQGQRLVVQTARRDTQASAWIDAEESLRQFITRIAAEISRQCRDSAIAAETRARLLSNLYWIEVDLKSSPAAAKTYSALEGVNRVVVRPNGGSVLEKATFLNPLLRYVAHGKLRSTGDLEGESVSLLLARRLSPAGLISPKAEPHEMQLFEKWFNSVIAPGVAKIITKRKWNTAGTTIAADQPPSISNPTTSANASTAPA